MANGMGCTRDLPGVESTGFSIAMRRGDILSTGRLMGTPANASRWIASIPSRPSTESIPTGVCRASPNCRCRWPSRKHRPTPANGATRDSICGPGPRDSRMRFYSSVNALLATVHSEIVRSWSVTITTTRCKSFRALFLRGALATDAGKSVPGTQCIAGWFIHLDLSRAGPGAPKSCANRAKSSRRRGCRSPGRRRGWRCRWRRRWQCRSR
ncbi:hypothetical protein OKW49_007630 [Paraburkholderia youngii]